ncbi:response regulator [Bradyrhizobium sp. DOA1]|uniref:response regulator n=1 Tax=Bradyrhizobium sp. DOA1 TaxID=1126616 RepID=UPI0007C75439|nr:response regulator [Bradyrhizobium sp. DOA1]
METQKLAKYTRTILLAEDDVLLRMSIADYLRGCGYKVLEAVSAHEAIEFLQDQDIHIDLVLSNVELAGDGFGIAKWIKDHRANLELRLTDTVKRAVDAAASLCEDGPLPAPYNSQILHSRVTRLLATRRPPPTREGRRISLKRT